MTTTTENEQAREALRLCERCAIPHLENCPECLGFGVYDNGAPVVAFDAIEKQLRHPVLRCIFCGSDERGAASRTSPFTRRLSAVDLVGRDNTPDADQPPSDRDIRLVRAMRSGIEQVIRGHDVR
jgi:hypothetical protein